MTTAGLPPYQRHHLAEDGLNRLRIAANCANLDFGNLRCSVKAVVGRDGNTDLK